ncbi:MAG TPA: efflux RND transporter permease subunit [Terriglobales bacterium]|nr:efflux RND transporter permease subunit [Terriglobales bacterium]
MSQIDPELSAANAPSSERETSWLSTFSRPLVFLIITVALVGGYEALRLPISVFPQTDFPRIVVGVDNGVMPIDQMMVTITRPLEEAVNSVPGLQSVQSITSRGSAEIDLFFNWNVDMVTTLQLVDAAMAQAQGSLPPTATIDSHRLTFASFPILGYSLTSDTVPQTELWEMATYDMKPRLNRLDGVATVLIQGGQEPEFQITPDPAKLVAAGVTVQQMLDAVQATNLVDSPGLIERNHQLFLGLVNGQVTDPSQIGQIVVKTTQAGVPVRVGDLAAVSRSVKPVYTLVNANGKPAVLLSINRQPLSNTMEVAHEVHAAVANLQKSLPAGVHLQPYYDQSTIVGESITSVRDAIIIGLILASIVMVLFLRDWGSSLVAGLVIPATILITFVVMGLLGESFDLMTLGGLAAAVGLVIDDAIVVVENIVLHRDAGEGRIAAIQSALREISKPLVGSTITPIVVFVPLISITGVTGVFFRALAVTVGVALLTSLALALTWTPVLSQFFLRKRATGHLPANFGTLDPAEKILAAEQASLGRFFSRVVDFYERWLRRVVARPLWLVAFSVVLIAASWLCYNALGSDLLPEMDEGGFVLDYVMPPGSSLAETNRVLTGVENILRNVPEVAGTSRRTGLQLGLAAVTEANTGDVSVLLKKDRDRGIDEVIDDVRSQVSKQYPQLDIDFTQVLQDMIGDLTSAPQPVVIKLFNENGDLLNQWAPKVADAIGKVHGVVDVLDGVEDVASGPAVEFRVDPTVAAHAGFTAQEVATDASALLEGEPATVPVVANDRAYTLRVRFPESARATLDDMRNTVLVSASGHTATLGALSTVTELDSQSEILRDNLQRRVAVSARLEGVDLGTGVAAVQRAVANLHLPPGIRVEYGGTYAEQQKSFHDLVVVLVLAIVLVFIVLLFEFRDFAAPVGILASALLSTSGVFFALLVTGTTFNVASFMGLIMVVGIVAKNGILLLDADQNFRGMGLTPMEAMVQAGRRRLRPIVMTALAAIAGMLPLAFALGAGSQMLQPLAIAVIGGIVISMVLSLLITPVVYYFMSSKTETRTA